MKLTFLRAKNSVQIIRQFIGNLKDFLLSCCPVIGYCTFNKMSGTIELMAFQYIRPFFIRFLNGKISIQITVLFLGFCDQINDSICFFLQLRIPLQHQDIAYCFQPFIYITVLKYLSIKMPFHFATGNSQIVNGMAGLSILSSVI